MHAVNNCIALIVAMIISMLHMTYNNYDCIQAICMDTPIIIKTVITMTLLNHIHHWGTCFYIHDTKNYRTKSSIRSKIGLLQILSSMSSVVVSLSVLMNHGMLGWAQQRASFWEHVRPITHHQMESHSIIVEQTHSSSHYQQMEERQQLSFVCKGSSLNL